jgi:aminopeptidase C
MVDTKDLKSFASTACGFESHPRHLIYFRNVALKNIYSNIILRGATMIATRHVEYLGSTPPSHEGTPNARLCMTENCGVVIKDCLLGSPLNRLATAELEEILSDLFRQPIKILVQKQE